MRGGGDEEVGGKDSGSEGREGKSNKDALRILDVCPAIVMLPNPLLDLRAARAAETTVGGFGMLESFTSKGKKTPKNNYSNDEETGYHFHLGIIRLFYKRCISHSTLLDFVVRFHHRGMKLK